MVIRILQTVVDDLDGSTDGVDTYRFSFDGVDHEIDLSEANAQRLRATLAPYVTAGRRLPVPRPAAGRGTDGTSAPKRVRAWWADNAQRQGLPAYRANGPLPRKVSDAYRHAHP